MADLDTAERESLQRQWQRDHDEMSARRKNAEARLAVALRRAEAAEAELAGVRELLEGASVLEIDFRLRDRILAVIGDVIVAEIDALRAENDRLRARLVAIEKLCEDARPHAYLYPGRILAVIGAGDDDR